jgi:hypothetical protein
MNPSLAHALNVPIPEERAYICRKTESHFASWGVKNSTAGVYTRDRKHFYWADRA